MTVKIIHIICAVKSIELVCYKNVQKRHVPHNKHTVEMVINTETHIHCGYTLCTVHCVTLRELTVLSSGPLLRSAQSVSVQWNQSGLRPP